MSELGLASDPLLSRLNALLGQLGSLVFRLPGYQNGALQPAVVPPEIEVALCHEFEMSAVLLDIQICDLTNRLLRDKERVALYPQVAAHLRETQTERKTTIKDYLSRKGIISSSSSNSA